MGLLIGKIRPLKRVIALVCIGKNGFWPVIPLLLCYLNEISQICFTSKVTCCNNDCHSVLTIS